MNTWGDKPGGTPRRSGRHRKGAGRHQKGCATMMLALGSLLLAALTGGVVLGLVTFTALILLLSPVSAISLVIWRNR